MYETIKKFLAEGGKCLLIENGKSIGVFLAMEEYDKLNNKPEIPKRKPEPVTINPIGGAMAREMEFPDLSAEAPFYGAKEGASANIDEINLADTESITLEDLGLDELPY